MDDLNIIDGFMDTFVRYIESGFGLLEGEVAFLTTIIVTIDITLAGLFWALSEDHNVIGRLLRKVLYVGAFALILNNFGLLADIIFESFAGLGLTATGSSLDPEDLLRPGNLAATGFSAAYPLLKEAGDLLGFSTLWDTSNALSILILLFAWLVVILAFFILAVQLFITVLEFKLTTLAGFVLVPFALWSRTAFLAERVLGAVISAGIKVMVLAVIVGIGTGLFDQFIAALEGREVGVESAMSLMLASISLFGLGIFGPGIAAGLVTGAPQLGAGAAVGTVAGLAAGAAAGAGMAAGAGRTLAAGAGGAIKAASSLAGGASTAYGLGRSTSGATGLAGAAAGAAGVARAGAGAVGQGIRNRVAAPIQSSYQGGAQGGWTATGGQPLAATGTAAASGAATAPHWAQRLQAEQRLRHRAATTVQSVREGDRPGQAANPSLEERDRD